MALEHNVLVVSVSAALSGSRDPFISKKRIDDFVDALRRVTKQGVRLPARSDHSRLAPSTLLTPD